MLGLGLTEILMLLILGAILAVQYGKKKKNLPPGPPAFPIVGNIFQMTGKAHLKMAEWARRYGKMYTIQLGSSQVIVLNDVKLIKEVLSDVNFSNRPPMPVLEQFCGGQYGIISTNGAAWEEQRRWSLRKLRDFGFGKTSMEGMIMDEVNEVLVRMRKSGGKEYIRIKEFFDLAVLNALWTLLNGERMSQDDPKIREVLDTFHQILPVISESGIAMAPWLKYIFPGAQRKIDETADRVVSFARNAVAHHFDTYQEGESRDFIDEYITEIRKTTDPKSSFFRETGRKHLEGTMSDLIQAGSETTSNTINWTLIYLSENPEVQKKLHKELDSVVGTSRSVSMSDKPNLPYTEAVIYETLRHSALVAGGVQHAAIEDKEVGGYLIPKDAWILTNIYYVHHDPAIWGDPENFRPERFLSPDGKKALRPEALIPFQLGRRQCAGESLARDTLFLFTSNIFQQFSIDRLEKGEAEPIAGTFLVPKDYHFRFQSRVNK